MRSSARLEPARLPPARVPLPRVPRAILPLATLPLASLARAGRALLAMIALASVLAATVGAAPALAAQDQPLPAPDTLAVQADPADFMGRSESTLMAQGSPRRFGGIGASWLGLLQDKAGPPRMPTEFEVKDVLATIQMMVSGNARAVSLGVTAGCPACLVPDQAALKQGALNQDSLKHADMVLRLAHDAGVKIVIPLSGGHSTCPAGTPDPVADTACIFARWHGLDAPAFYTDPGIRADFAAAITRMLTHTNPLTGRADQDDPTIMAWENCDGCGQGIDPKILADWTEFVGRTIKQVDRRHLYENGAFAGRLGTHSNDVPAPLLALSTVDIVGDRVMPGIDPAGAGMNDAVDAVTRASRIYIIDAYGWTPAQWPNQDDFQAFLKAIIKNRAIAGAFVSDLSGHAEAGGYLPSGPAGSPQGPALYFPGWTTPAADAATMQARSRAVRRLSFGMYDLLTQPFVNVDQPLILSAAHGKLVWRGAAGAVSYGVARSTDIATPGSWTTLCEQCATDAQPSWQDPSPASGPVWYRMIPYNANAHAGMYSEPVKDR